MKIRADDRLALAVLADLNKTVSWSAPTLARGVFYECAIDPEFHNLRCVTLEEENLVKAALARLVEAGLAREGMGGVGDLKQHWYLTDKGERSCNARYRTARDLPRIPLHVESFT